MVFRTDGLFRNYQSPLQQLFRLFAVPRNSRQNEQALGHKRVLRPERFLTDFNCAFGQPFCFGYFVGLKIRPGERSADLKRYGDCLPLMSLH